MSKQLLIDIAFLLAEKAGKHLSQAYLYAQSGEHRKESEECIEAVIIFQASMEAVINEEIESHRGLKLVREENEELYRRFRSLSFKNKWERAYVAVDLQDELHYLSSYFEFYTKYRVPITHPQSRYEDISEFNWQSVYKGIQSGWYAAHVLLAKLEKQYSQDTWEDYCNKCGLPISFLSSK